MTLTHCPECGHLISNQARTCPKCGGDLRTLEQIKLDTMSDMGTGLRSMGKGCTCGCTIPILLAFILLCVFAILR